MEDNILDEEWKRPEGGQSNIIWSMLGLIGLNSFMYFIIIPMEQTQTNRHTFSPISFIVFLIMLTCFIIGIRNVLKKKNGYINYLLIGLSLIFWLYILAQIECFSCSKV